MTRPFHRYLTAQEEKRLLAAIDRVKCPYAARDHAWIRLALNTGVRLGAMSRLTVGDARQAVSCKHLLLRAEIQKRGQEHEVFCNRHAVQALKDLLANRKALGLHNEDLDAPLIVGRTGKPLSPRSYQARLKVWAAEAGLSTEMSPHWLRHTLAKRVIATTTANDPLGVVQRVLGHRRITSTGVYTEPDKEAVEQALEGIRS